MEMTATQPEPMTMPESQAEHQWLQHLVGEWTLDGEALMGPGQPPVTLTGTERCDRSGTSGFSLRETAGCPMAAPRRR